MRHFFAAVLSDPTLTPADLRVAMAVVELTAAHGKFRDLVVRREIADRADVSERTVTRAVKKFAERKLVIWNPARAKGQFSELILCHAPPDKPEQVNLTRDRWLSRVQPTTAYERETNGCPASTPNARQSETRRETSGDATRDLGDGSLPPLDHHLPPREARCDAVIDHIVESRMKNKDIHNREAYEAKVRDSVLADVDLARLARIVERHPHAPISMLAGAALGEHVPSLREYLREDLQ
jgi:hypothetical protein